MIKITLITGATSGLGKSLAKKYVENNENVLLVGRNIDKLKSVKDELSNINKNVLIDIFAVDLSDNSRLHEIKEYTDSKQYFVNNLVNNAGFGERKDFVDMDPETQVQMTNVCCNAVVYLLNVYIKDMLKNDEGHIINVASIAGLVPGPYMSTYHAVKSYVVSLGEAVSHEIRKTNVHLLTLCPGPFDSEFVSKAHNDYTFAKLKPISSDDVANIAYNKSIKNKRFYIIGAKNRFLMFITRFVSRNFAAASTAKTIKKE